MSLVGKDINAYCTKCKLLLTHVVLYEVNGAVAGVKCKTCGSEHKYRLKKVAAKSSTAVKRTKAVSAKSKETNESPLQWELKCREMNSELPAKAYHIQEIYLLHDVVKHPVFGIGFVEQVISETRMNVLFKDAVKLMAMNTNL